MKKIILLLYVILSFGLNVQGQGTVTRPNTPTSSQSNKPNKTTGSNHSNQTTSQKVRPISVKSISFSNTEYDNTIINPNGSKLYSQDMRYLTFSMEYNGSQKSETKTIYVKIFDPSGNLKSGSSSPGGYTWSYVQSFESGNNNRMEIGGFGNQSKSIYSPGLYDVEFYWDGKLQYKSSVRIYSRDAVIKGVSYGNFDKPGNTINPFGSVLHTGNMRYLGFNLKYDGPPTSETKKVYVKIFSPDGSMRTATTSPSGYTMDYNATFEPGSNNEIWLGTYGNETRSSYVPGEHRIEFYWDGKLQYQSSVRIYE